MKKIICVYLLTVLTSLAGLSSSIERVYKDDKLVAIAVILKNADKRACVVEVDYKCFRYRITLTRGKGGSVEYYEREAYIVRMVAPSPILPEVKMPAGAEIKWEIPINCLVAKGVDVCEMEAVTSGKLSSSYTVSCKYSDQKNFLDVKVEAQELAK